jgi:hypothetical protein
MKISRPLSWADYLIINRSTVFHYCFAKSESFTAKGRDWPYLGRDL